MKNRKMQILMGLLILLQVYAVVSIHALNGKILRLEADLAYLESQTEAELNHLYNHVERRMEEQESLLHTADLEVGELDVQTLSVPITFTVEPKTITDTLKVMLDMAGETLPLEKNGFQYVGTRHFHVTELSGELTPGIVLEDNGVQQVAEQLSLSYMSEKLFPYIWARFSGSSSWSSWGEYRMNGTLSINYQTAEDFGVAPFQDMTYIVQIDGATVEETPLVLSEESRREGVFTMEMQQTYPLTDGQTFLAYVKATDGLGFVYEYPVRHYVAGAESQREPYFEERRIYAPDGTLLYDFGEQNYHKIE